MCRKLIYLATFVVVLSMVSNASGQMGQGNILYEYWNDISGTAVSQLTNDPRYPDNPDEGEWLQSFEGHVNWRDNYGIRARGYVYPPANGDYNFWISGDDECQLWLSTDDDPANIVRIANVSGWSNPLEWDKFDDQKSKSVTLVAGKKYYIEALMKEGGGGDSLAVAWGGPIIGAGPVVIEGKYLSPFMTSFADTMRVSREPIPADGTMLPDIWVSLIWSAGFTAASHNVYFSDNLADVEASAAEASRGNQTSTNFVAGFPGFPYPDGFVPGTTYYWRIDEVEADGTTIYEGNIWSFTVPPKTGYNPDPADGAGSVDPNVELNWEPGFGVILHHVYFGDNFAEVNNGTGGTYKGPAGFPEYTPGTLELEKVYFWRVDEFDAINTYKGDVWGFATPGAAESLMPSNGATNVRQTQILKWSPGDSAASHQVYFGTNKEVVRNANTGSPEYKGNRDLGSQSYDPGKLQWDTTYYWRVDGIDNTNPDSPWVGLVWSFTTANFLIVDDFESYNDLDPADPESNRIFNVWLDGYLNPTNGSLVGYETPPFAEQTIVHGGSQSIPLYYDNSVGYSEATLTLTYPRDWTENGVTTLTIWFRGDAANASETLYVALNGNTIVTNDNPNAAQVGEWTQWNIDLQAFADQGVNMANVNTIALGLGNRNSPVAGGSGTMYFDDIRLYPPPPEAAP
jgi:hypothetical protein